MDKLDYQLLITKFVAIIRDDHKIQNQVKLV